MMPENQEIKTMSQLEGQTLEIIQPSIWKNYFEIRYNDQILGNIKTHGWFGSILMVEFFGKEWEIYRPSFWLSEIDIREKGKENPFASYKRKLFSREGFVHLPKGKRLKIKLGIFRSTYDIYNMMGKCVVSLRDKVIFKSVTEVKIEESSEILDEYPWVIVLAWNLARQGRKSRRAG